MKRVVLDTNVLVSFLTDRNAEQQERASTLFEAASAGELGLILHQIVITELVYVLRNLYGVAVSEIAQTIGELLSSPGVVPIDEVVWTRVLELWPRRISDFADAVLAAAARHGRYDAVATFDRPFSRRLVREGLTPFWAEETTEGPTPEGQTPARPTPAR